MAAYLTNAEMAAVIAAGGSVIHNGRLITAAADLPTDSEIADFQGQNVDTVPANTSIRINAGGQQVIDDVLTVNGSFEVNGKIVVHQF